MPGTLHYADMVLLRQSRLRCAGIVFRNTALAHDRTGLGNTAISPSSNGLPCCICLSVCICLSPEADTTSVPSTL